jgi:membrane protease YdiL (CAAX protease family)
MRGRDIVRSAPLRLLLLFLLMIVAYGACQLAGIFSERAAAPVGPSGFVGLAVAAFGGMALLLLYGGAVRLLERRRPAEISRSHSIRDLLAGAAAGLFLFCLAYTLFGVLGVAHWRGLGGTGGLAAALALALLSGVGEELIFRGVLFRILDESFGTAIALLVSSSIFGALHLANRGATGLSACAVALEAGLLLGAAFVLTRSLWLAIGLHFGWNFAEGGIFGAAVSGEKSHGLLDVTLAGPDWMTGGQFGPEGSVVSLTVCLAAAVVLLALAIRNKRWRRLHLSLGLPPAHPEAFDAAG